MSDPRRLPALPRLLAFEAAARHGSFSAAAEALGSSQSAVSQQVAGLEAMLGRPLFRRLHRGVAPTEAGLVLLDAVSRGLDGIAAALAALRQEPARTSFTIAADFGFASYWLMPRLHALSETLEGVDVRIVTAQSAPDAAATDADATILFGDPGLGTLLFPERVRPVCSPGFRDAHGRAEGLDWSRLPLLHLEAPDSARWLRWTEWFAGAGLPPRRRAHPALRFNTYPLVLEAAVLGEGVALGWEPLTDRLLRSGALVTLGPVVETGQAYVLAEPAGRTGHPARLRFREWLLAACEGRKAGIG